MLEALFAAAAEAVFSYILDTLEPTERLRDWLKRNPVKLAYQHALARTYAAFASGIPDLPPCLWRDLLQVFFLPFVIAKVRPREAFPQLAMIGHAEV